MSNTAVQSLEAIWDNRSPFSVLPKPNGVGRSVLSGLPSSRTPSAGPFGSANHSSIQLPSHGHVQEMGKVPILQEKEAEMGFVAHQNRLHGTTSRQRLHQEQQHMHEMRLRQQEERYMLELSQSRQAEAPRSYEDFRVTEHDQHMLEQEHRRILQEQQRRLLLEEEQRRLLLLEQERELERQQLQDRHRLQSQRLLQQQQQTPPPRMLPVSQSPRFFEHQRQLLQQQQQQSQMEDLQRQLLNSLSLQQQGGHESRRRLTEHGIQAPQLLHQHQQRNQRSQSPSVNQFNDAGIAQDLDFQNIQLQQRLLSEMAHAEFMREMQVGNPKQIGQQDALRAEAMRKILEAEKMEEKRRRKAAKIAHMVGL